MKKKKVVFNKYSLFAQQHMEQQHMEFYHAPATNQNSNDVATASSSAAPASEDLRNYEGGPHNSTLSSSSSSQEYDPANPGYIPTPLKNL